MLSLHNVSYRVKNFSLQGIELKIKRGEIVYLVGCSGSGKSTLLRNIAGLDNPFGGSIYINEKLVFCSQAKVSVPPEHRRVGFVFQYPSLFPSKNVIENVMFAASSHLTQKERYALAVKMLENVNMLQYINSAPHELSGGQQQLIVLARAFAQDPAILLLDEPFSSLDVISKKTIKEEVINDLRKRELTAIFVTHDPEEALSNADVIYVIDDGQIIGSGSPSEIYYSPKSAKIAMLFGEINKISGKTEGGIFKSDFGEYEIKSGKTYNELYVRPEGIILAREGQGISAVVESIHFSNKIAKIRINEKVYSMYFTTILMLKKYDTISVVLDCNQVLFL